MRADLRRELIRKVQAQGLPSSEAPLPVVSLEDFFLGNSDCGSIGCNLSNNPGPQVFFKSLKAVRDDDSVQEILVEVNEIVEDAQTWPFADRVYLLSSAAIDQVRSWLMPLRPDEVSEGWANGIPPAAPALKPGVKVYAAWWD
jgi:hypothetical protein